MNNPVTARSLGPVQGVIGRCQQIVQAGGAVARGNTDAHGYGHRFNPGGERCRGYGRPKPFIEMPALISRTGSYHEELFSSQAAQQIIIPEQPPSTSTQPHSTSSPA